MSEPNVHPETGRVETESQRLDRNTLELMAELRVALPGVQVLFAFLLIVPFTNRFEEVSPFLESIYLLTLLCTAAASAFLIAPSVHHRLRFRRQEKEQIVVVGNRLAIVGLGLLAVAMTGAVGLITGFLFPAVAAVVCTVAAAAMFTTLWYGVPQRWR